MVQESVRMEEIGISEKISDKENVKKTEKYFTQYLAVLSATIVSTIGGISFAWPSPSLPRLENGEYNFKLTQEEASYIALIAPLGTLLGGPLSASLVDRIGRKQVLLLTSIPQFLSFLLIYFGYDCIALLFLGRFLGGIGEGVNFTIMAMYIGEIAHPKIRGNLGSFMSITLRLGILVINILGSYLSIQVTALVLLCLPLLFLVSFIKMPESPYYLLMKENVDGARASLKFLRQCRDDNEVVEELSRLQADVERQLSESGTFSDLFRIDSNRKALFVGLGLRTFQQFSGIAAFSLYTQTLFKDALDGIIEPEIAAICYSIVQLIMTFVSAVIVDKTGRKPLLVMSSITCMLVLLMEAIYFTLRDFFGFNISNVKWLPMFGMIVFIIVFSLGLGTLVNLMLGELFSASVKSKALALLNGYFAVIMTITTKFFQFMNYQVGLAVPFFVFAVFCFFGTFFLHYYVPETKNKTLEEIQQFLKKGAKNEEKTGDST